MFGSVVSGQLVFSCLVEADTDVAVGLACCVGDFVFGGESYLPVAFVDSLVDTPSTQRDEMFFSVDIKRADVRCSTDQLDFDFSGGSASGVVGLDAVEPVADTTLLLVGANETDMPGLEESV